MGETQTNTEWWNTTNKQNENLSKKKKKYISKFIFVQENSLRKIRLECTRQKIFLHCWKCCPKKDRFVVIEKCCPEKKSFAAIEDCYPEKDSLSQIVAAGEGVCLAGASEVIADSWRLSHAWPFLIWHLQSITFTSLLHVSFNNNNNMKLKTLFNEFFVSKPSDFYCRGIDKLVKCWQKVMENEEYIIHWFFLNCWWIIVKKWTNFICVASPLFISKCFFTSLFIHHRQSSRQL